VHPLIDDIFQIVAKLAPDNDNVVSLNHDIHKNQNNAHPIRVCQEYLAFDGNNQELQPMRPMPHSQQ
jgi:hypothetical protein